ncbi:MAG: NAD(P)-binding domain-containing protein [Holosporales bacterium]|jgi:pyrroline-5-carboxylate reductase|nr:NAD(P)-binding domain-containing protein [Holosporales bacterium]
MNILLIGCGNIGGALLKLWVALDVADKIIVVQPSLSSACDFDQYSKVAFVRDVHAIPKDFSPDGIVLAIKPQIAAFVAPNLCSYMENAILISMLAGTSLSRLEDLTSHKSKIIRMMPTVAIKTQQSVNLAFANRNANHDSRSIVKKIIEISGEIIWVKEEKHIDILTPISGAGPAYFFLLAEILIEETIKFGIDENIARSIIQRLFIGSASIAAHTANFASLRQSVASKKGVTEAALEIMSSGMRAVIQHSLQKALIRLKELQR